VPHIIDPEIERARQAVDRHAWGDALEILTTADATTSLRPEDLERLAEAAWWSGKLSICIDARERAYPAYIRAGDKLGAGRVALNVAHDYSQKGDGSLFAGWLGRAERLLKDLPLSPEHGYLVRMKSAAAISRGELDDAMDLARRTLEIGEELGNPSLQALGLHDQGRIHIRQGEVEEGLALLDEAVVAAVSEELEPYATGVVYCNAINICQDLTDFGRAGQWTEAARRWCERQSITGFPGVCRVRRAHIVQLRGAWTEAENEARQAVTELQDWYVEVAAEGFYEIGEIRLKIGDLPAAEEAFRRADELGREAQPGLALLRLAEGNVETARTGIRGALEQTEDQLTRVRLLPTEVQAAIAATELDAAREAVAELEKLVQTYDTPALRAVALTARGRLEIAEGNGGAAVRSLRQAWRLWNDVDAPYEGAQARRLLGDAFRSIGDEGSARLELEAARSAFDRLGGTPEARAIDQILGTSPEERAVPEQTLRTFMFTDIVKSTSLVEAIGDAAWGSLIRWHDELLRALFAQHGGDEVDHAGDGFFVSFADGGTAVECAVAIQRALAEHRATHGFAPQLRIGLHAVPATRMGKAYRGKGVHEAARIAAIAGEDEIIASRATVEEASTRFPVSSVKNVNLKGIKEPVEVVTIGWR
jgi:class 3 adenylate cyclase